MNKIKLFLENEDHTGNPRVVYADTRMHTHV